MSLRGGRGLGRGVGMREGGRGEGRGGLARGGSHGEAGEGAGVEGIEMAVERVLEVGQGNEVAGDEWRHGGQWRARA